MADELGGYLNDKELDRQLTIDLLTRFYNELIEAVKTKHPGETRHETALRYIREREARYDGRRSEYVGIDNAISSENDIAERQAQALLRGYSR